MKSRLILLGLASLLLALILASSSLVFTESGSRWLVKRLASPPELGVTVSGIRGTVWDGLAADEIRYVSEDWRIVITQLALTTEPKDILRPRLNIVQLAADRMRIEQLQPDKKRDPKPLVFPDIPINVLLQALRLDRLELDAFGLNETITDIQLAGELIGTQLSLEQIALELRNIAMGGKADLSLNESLAFQASVNWRAPELGLSGHGTLDGNLQNIAIQQSVATPDQVEVQAQITQVGGAFGYEIQVQADQLRPPNAPDSLRLGTLSAFLSGDKNRLRINDFRATLLGGEVTGGGDIELRDKLPIHLQFFARQLELHRLAEIPNAPVNFDAELTGSLLDEQALRVDQLRGKLGDYVVAASLIARRQQDRIHIEEGAVAVGDNRADFQGRITPDIQAQFDLDAQDLSQLLPDLDGKLVAQGAFAGSLSQPILALEGRGRTIKFRNQSIESLAFNANIDNDGQISGDLSAASIEIANRPWGDASLTIGGELDNHQLTFQLRGGNISADLQSQGQYRTQGLSQNLSAARIDLGALGVWQLEDGLRAQLDLDSGHFSTSAHCWRLESASACVDELSRTAQGLAIAARLSDFPAEQFNLVTPDYMRLQGKIGANLEVSESEDHLQGFMDISEENLSIELTTDEEVLVTNIDSAELKISGSQKSARANLELAADHDSRLQAQLIIDSPFASSSALSGRFDGQFPDLSKVSALLEAATELRDIRGALNAEGRFLGSLQRPQITGGINLTDGGVMMPAAGIDVSNIKLSLVGDQNGQTRITGRASSGEGHVELNGSVSLAEGSVGIKIAGDRFESLRLPDQQALSSPDIQLSYRDQTVSLDGILRIPAANFIVNEIPETAVKPSPDAIDHEAPDTETKRRILRVNGAVKVVLGEAVQFDGMGLKTKLKGELTLSQTQKRQLFANGVLQLVDGRFNAYGQSLNIERGRLIFAGPIDNPRVDVKASRTINYEGQIVKAGVILSGMADNISTRVYAEPAMSEANALSYLVIGRPIDAAGSGDSAALRNAAITMGLRQALPVIQRVGDTLGLDEVGIGGDSTNETAFLAGKQLNEDLSIRYTYGLFSRIGTFIARYSLGRGFSIEASSGEDQALELIYTVER